MGGEEPDAVPALKWGSRSCRSLFISSLLSCGAFAAAACAMTMPGSSLRRANAQIAPLAALVRAAILLSCLEALDQREVEASCNTCAAAAAEASAAAAAAAAAVARIGSALRQACR